MIIEKIATEKNYMRRLYSFDRARDGFKAFLSACTERNNTILLPSFIGWSSREGSGVFDPVKEQGLNYEFYKMTEMLTVDVSDLRQKLQGKKIKVLVLIHYFGHVDPSYYEIIKLAKDHGCLILEDEAHALYTDIIDGASGRQGDASIFSVHKMLPEKKGGILVLNNTFPYSLSFHDDYSDVVLMKYDLYSIALKRKQNTAILLELLSGIEGVHPLWNLDSIKETLQTCPVIIEDVNRDVLYERMNEKGMGVVTLYHTLIPEIDKDIFHESYRLSKRILNLPVHQDVSEKQLKQLVMTLNETIKELKSK
ncbi:MAG: DegT/DnrJ/EryC1/StrS family aminotransferase [Bacteroidales bacterium]|nr:DegT/DnrJ/EryC1/StrS family aminotransferase [Bacteroidales bacterium]